MVLDLYKFAKRENSTKQPQGQIDGIYPVTGAINERCGVINPQISIRFGHDENPAEYNYLYLPDFQRYYYINEWTFNKGFWIANASCDVLASWRSSILNSQQYVTRAASASNGNIVDTEYPTKADVSIVYKDVTAAGGAPTFSKYYGDGTYILGVIGASANDAIGAAAYYAMPQSTLNTFFNNMLTNIDWANVNADEIGLQLQKMIFNPVQYIVSCMWLPFKISIPPSSELDSIPVGWWKIAAPGAGLLDNAQSLLTFVWKVEVPKHPQSDTRGNYLNLNPYSRYMFWGSPFGTVPLDSTLLVSRNTLRVEKTVDLVTGAGQLNVGVEDAVGNTQQVALTSGQIGVPIQLAQISSDIIGAYAGAVSTIGDVIAAATSKSPYGALVGMWSNIGHAVNAGFTQLRTGGSNGSTVGYQYKDHLIAYFTEIVDEDNEHLGRPLCSKRTLSTLSGYIECLDPDITIAATKNEIDEIKKYLSNGVYIE